MEDELYSKRSLGNRQEERGGDGKEYYAPRSWHFVSLQTGIPAFQQFNDGN